jgi:mannose-6-phosphate isomerase-like protein (cupin superfamily)
MRSRSAPIVLLEEVGAERESPAMVNAQPVNLTEVYMHVLRSGAIEALPKSIGSTESGEGTVVWDAQLDGVLVGQADVSTSSRHHGERHLDGDELVCLISGSVTLALEDGDAQQEVALEPGEAVVVPQGVWHRLLVDHPSRLLFLSTGRTEVRVPSR